MDTLPMLDEPLSTNAGAEPSGSNVRPAEDDPAGTPPPPKKKRYRSAWKKGLAPSCKECSRLKLKCSREVPCSNCVRRGCASVCPSGTMPARSQLPLVDEVRDLRQENARLRQQLQAQQLQLDGSNPYSVPPPLDRSHSGADSSSNPSFAAPDALELDDKPRLDAGDGEECDLETLAAVADAEKSTFGTGQGNEYYGRGAGALRFVDASEGPPLGRNGRVRGPASLHLPFFSSPSSRSIAEIRKDLPQDEDAAALINIFIERVTWMYQPVTRQDLESTLALAKDVPNAVDLHRLAALFMSFAIGEIFRMSPVQLKDSAVKAQRLQRATFYFNNASSLLTAPDRHFMMHLSVGAVQTLHCMTLFSFVVDIPAVAKSAWMLLGMALRVAQALGLHRDPRKLSSLSPEVQSERARVWWEVRTYELLSSLNFGRPYALPRYSDCPLPRVLAQPSGDDARLRAFHDVKHSMGILFERVSDLLSPSELPAYDDVLALDRDLRQVEANAPPFLQPGDFTDRVSTVDPVEGMLSVQRHMVALLLHKSLLALHRPWFAKAVTTHTEPMLTPYAASFNVCILSARKHTELMRSILTKAPIIATTWWFFVFHTATAAVIQAAVVLLAPHSMLCGDVLKDFEQSFSCLSEVSGASTVARRSLPILSRLRRRIRSKREDTAATAAVPAPPANQASPASMAHSSPGSAQSFSSLNFITQDGLMDLDAMLTQLDQMTSTSQPWDTASLAATNLAPPMLGGVPSHSFNAALDPPNLLSASLPAELQDQVDGEAIDPLLRAILHWNPRGGAAM